MAGVARSVLVPDCSSRGSSGWDKNAAASADAYLANSTVVAERIRSIYGIDAEVVPPPPAITADGPSEPISGLEPGYLLCVSRLLPYKNVDVVVEAASALPDERLVIAGTGPMEHALRLRATSNVTFTGIVTDPQLRWLYANCRALIAASYEDFGLTPLEAASFGKPTAALRWGGFLDTIEEGRTGVYFDQPTTLAVTGACRSRRWLRPPRRLNTSWEQCLPEGRVWLPRSQMWWGARGTVSGLGFGAGASLGRCRGGCWCGGGGRCCPWPCESLRWWPQKSPRVASRSPHLVSVVSVGS